MDNAFLPGTVRQRLADLMKIRKVSQTDLALKIGCGTPAYQADLATIENQFMSTVREVKKEIGNDFTVQRTRTSLFAISLRLH